MTTKEILEKVKSYDLNFNARQCLRDDLKANAEKRGYDNTNSFINWSTQDLWNQYQFCQEKPNSFNNNILKKVIKEIKNRR